MTTHRLESLTLKQHGTVDRDKKLESMLDRVEVLLDKATTINAEQVPDASVEDMPLTAADELANLLGRMRDEIAQYRYRNWWDEIKPPTREKIEDAALLRLAGRSWGDIKEDFEYRGVPFHQSGRLKKQIDRRARHVERLRALSNENDDNA